MNQDGSRLSYQQAFRRSFFVWVRGVGLGLPIISIVTQAVSYETLKEKHETPWDAKEKFIVEQNKLGHSRIFITTLLVLAHYGLAFLGILATFYSGPIEV
jgi:hypothetical protein